jgi:hypothetical protein
MTRGERGIPFWFRQPKESAILWEVDTVYSEVDEFGRLQVPHLGFRVPGLSMPVSISIPILVRCVKRNAPETD